MSTSSEAPLWEFPSMRLVSERMNSPVADILASLNALQGKPTSEGAETIGRAWKFMIRDSAFEHPAVLAIVWIKLFRLLLRAGCRPMLDFAGRELMTHIRKLPPCKYQGIAAGLMAEWALAVRCGKVALTYARESLASREQPQRIRGYLALAHALLGDAVGAGLQGACAYDSTQLQRELSKQAGFAQLHRLRVSLILGEGLPHHSPGLDELKYEPNINAMFVAAHWVYSPDRCSSTQRHEALKQLFDNGRTRDIILLEPFLSCEERKWYDDSIEYVNRLAPLGDDCPSRPAWPVTDAKFMEELADVSSVPPQAIWSCI